MIQKFDTAWEDWLECHPKVKENEELKHKCFNTFGRMYELMKLEAKYEAQADAVDAMMEAVKGRKRDIGELRKIYGTLCSIDNALEHLQFLTNGTDGSSIMREIGNLSKALGEAKEYAEDARTICAKALDSLANRERVNLRKVDLTNTKEMIGKYMKALEELGR